MDKIQDTYYIDNIPYSDLPKSEKEVIDAAAELLKDWEATILSFYTDSKKPKLNIITNHPAHNVFLDIDVFPRDLADKMFKAYLGAKDDISSSR